MTRNKVRVAAGQGFWGDWLEAPVRQVRGGPIDYLMMDYLAEVTMSIMQKQKSRDPSAGYARDFVPLMERILPDIVEKGIKVTSNAGGVNPRGCSEAVLDVARRLGLSGKVHVGLVTGDDLLDRLDQLIAAGHPLSNMETGRPLAEIRSQVLSANAYLGMGPIVEALRGGANVVVTSGVTIGERCVIGANSVVTQNLPPRSIAAGSPAKVLKTIAYGATAPDPASVTPLRPA